MNIPNKELSPNRAPTEFCRIAVPKTVLLKDDRTDFAREERLGLPYWTKSSAICVVVDVSICLDIPLTPAFNDHLDHGFTVLKDVQSRLTLRRMCVRRTIQRLWSSFVWVQLCFLDCLMSRNDFP